MILVVLIYFALLIPTPKQLEAINKANPDQFATTIKWYWEDEFTLDEKEKVRNWLHSVTIAVDSTIGPFPFDLHFHIFKRYNSKEPVPWANTRRSPSSQGVDFHIDPDFSLAAFIGDWTAPHEISHLSISYLGREHTWFAEGYASFFLRLDQSLRVDYDTSLPELIREYQFCCRVRDNSLDEVIASWDGILGGTTCHQLLRSYGTESAAKILDH